VNLPKTLQMHRREGRLEQNHPYLFRSTTGNDIFLDVQREIAKLNDFCVVLDEGLKTHSTISEKDSYVPDPFGGAYKKRKDDEYFTDVEGYWADDVGVLFGPASSCVLLYLFVIKFLRDLNICYNEYNYTRWLKSSKKKNRKPELVELIELLQVRLNKNFHVLDDGATKILLIDRLRSIRNSFMHGDWESVDEMLVGVNLVLSFKLVSDMFSKIEANIDDEKLSRILVRMDTDTGISINQLANDFDEEDEEPYDSDNPFNKLAPSYFDEELGERVEFPPGSRPIFDSKTLKWKLPNKNH
jgi:hypothetical protein